MSNGWGHNKYIEFLWRWGELNSRPNKPYKQRLHV